MGTLTGLEPGEQAKTIDGRIDEIKDVMRKDRPKYNRENMAEELRDLVTKSNLLKGAA